MDVLGRLVVKAEELQLLEPLASRPLRHRTSLYAEDVVMFLSPNEHDLTLVKSLLDKYGAASGLRANLVKSSVVPIACNEDDVLTVRQNLDCQISSFPCKYLGLPLSTRRLTSADLQPILDKIADMLPGWKAALLERSGRLVLVKAMLTAIPIYVLLAIDVPKWFIKAINKSRRQFLWAGRKQLSGGHCPVNWQRDTRPLHLGGLGVHDLQTLAWALRMRWLWMERTDPDRPWAILNVKVPQAAAAMFVISISTTVGDGGSTSFWLVNLRLGVGVMPFVHRRGWRTRTVCDALHQNAWVLNIIGGLSV